MYTRYLIAIVLAAVLSPAIVAQQQTGDRRDEVPIANPTATPIPAKPVGGAERSNREDELLRRIELLEKRIGELETAKVNSQNMASKKDIVDPAIPKDPGSPAGSSKTGGSDNKVPVNVPNTVAQPAAAPEEKVPFAFADFTWLTGNPRTTESPLQTSIFTGEFRVDANYTSSFQHPKDNTIGGSSEIFRSGEFQLTQLGVGGDFNYKNVRGRFMTQFGLYSQTTPRNDPSPSRGQWNLDSAYRFVSEAYGGYHINKWYGINIDAGIFMSYVGLYSYYQFDNWSYQPSYVSSNTPWFFNGVRIQIHPTKHLKIEPWIINGWQSYGKFNSAPGIGGQIKWAPNGSFVLVANNYFGTDTLGNKNRKRIHTDDSIQVKYYDNPNGKVSKGAFTFTFDAGCEFGGGVSCSGAPGLPAQYFLGFMAYNRWWFLKDKYAITLGGGAITNPGRYLVLIPPINGATATTGSPYFTANPGDTYRAWDASATFDYMPTQFSTFRLEYNHRAANVPYFSGSEGITPPGGNTGTPGVAVPGWAPDLRKFERRFTIALLIKL